ncbi:MAG: DoxX family protein [Xanthobacteraceae bacterium]|jgi:putative oxidoreductase
MQEVAHEPRLLLPVLEPFYRRAIPLSWLVIRIAVGWNLIVHAWGKIQLGPTRVAPAFANMGFEPGVLFYWITFLVEGLSGLGILLGLFTRFFAAAVAIEMFVIFCVYWHTGFSWLNRGYEYALLWGLVSFAVALRGGGPFSLDRKIGVQL